MVTINALSDRKTDQKAGTVLENLFTSRVRVKLLTLFITRPAEAYYIHQASRLTEDIYSNVRQELRNLAATGLLHSERRANAIFYRANTEHHLFPELKGIVLKDQGLSGASKRGE